jgi:hypothetical protein
MMDGMGDRLMYHGGRCEESKEVNKVAKGE